MATLTGSSVVVPGVVVPGFFLGGNSLSPQPAPPPTCCSREKEYKQFDLDNNCYGNVFDECVDCSNMKFTSKLKPGYFVNTTDNIYICTSCHKDTGSAMRRSEKVKSKPLTEQEAARHLASNECNGRKKAHSEKTENVFIFKLQSDMTLLAPEQFVKKGGLFDHVKFKTLISTPPAPPVVVPTAIYGRDESEDEQEDEQSQQNRNQYDEILIKEYCAQFERDLDKDNYTPITVNSEEEFRAVIRQFPFYKKSMEQEQFPRKFPFSPFVISAYTQAKQYLVGCLEFMDNLQLNTSAVDDNVRRCANVLLGRWAGILKTFVHKRVSMIQLVQITINLGYLEKSCESLGAFITSKTSGEEAIGTASHQVVLSEKVFRDVRSEVEQQIDECMRSKVDEIIELANYDWELPAAAGQASDFITDLIKFLLTTFQSFTNLPSGLAKHVCTQTCKHISQSLSDLLLSAETCSRHVCQ